MRFAVCTNVPYRFYRPGRCGGRKPSRRYTHHIRGVSILSANRNDVEVTLPGVDPCSQLALSMEKHPPKLPDVTTRNAQKCASLLHCPQRSKMAPLNEQTNPEYAVVKNSEALSCCRQTDGLLPQAFGYLTHKRLTSSMVHYKQDN